MEVLQEILQWLTMNLDRLFLYIGGSALGGISLWKLLSIFNALVKNYTARKYTKKTKEYTERLENTINSMKDFVRDTIKEEVKNYADTIKTGFNELQEKSQATKQKIYNEIFNKKEEVIEIVQDINTDLKAEIEPILNENEKVEEVVEEEPKIVVEEEKPNNKVDLL